MYFWLTAMDFNGEIGNMMYTSKHEAKAAAGRLFNFKECQSVLVEEITIVGGSKKPVLELVKDNEGHCVSRFEAQA